VKLITFSLFGDRPIYVEGAIENARLAREIYPGWVARFYVADDVSEDVIERLKSHGAEVIVCKKKQSYDGLLWRFTPLMEDDVEVWVSRDCDSRLGVREKAAVDEWLESGKSLHVMRDAHNHTYPIMAGMFGVHNTLFHTRYGMRDLTHEPRTIKRFFRKLIGRRAATDVRDYDQTLLRETLWKDALQDHICHDHWNNTHPVGTPTTKPGDHISADKAYGVGLVKYVTTRSLKPKESYPEGQDSRPFPPHDPITYGLYVGQTIDEHNQIILTTDTRWEYELRGIPCK
jgi:hypothetical protein